MYTGWPPPVTQRKLSWAALVAILGLAVLVRVPNLGSYTFHYDEVLHVLGAQSILDGGRPVLPSGLVYERGWLFTPLLAQTFRVLPINETSARLPSVAFNLMLILAVYLVGKAWFGNRVALVAAFLLALSPLDVLLSRFARMYTVFGLSYFLGTVCLYRATEPSRSPRRQLLYLGLAASLLLVSYRFTRLTLTVVPAFGVFCLLMSPRERLFRFVLAAGAIGLAILIIEGDFLLAKLRLATYRIPWSAGEDTWYYARFLVEHYSWLAVFYVVGAATAVRSWDRKAVYALCQFLVPMLVFIVVVQTRATRYSAHLYPFFFMVAALGLVRSLTWMWTESKKALGRRVAWNMSAPVKGTALLLGVGTAGAVLVSSTWVQDSVMISAKREFLLSKPAPVALLGRFLELVHVGKPGELVQVESREIYKGWGLNFPEWREARTYLEERGTKEDVIITTAPQSAFYYFGRVDYTFNPGIADIVHEVESTDGEVIKLDPYIGTPFLSSVEEIEQVVGEHPSGWLIAAEHTWALFLESNRRSQDEIERLVRERLTRHELPVRQGELLVFSWGRSVSGRAAR